MEAYEKILKKLGAFIQKYYTKILLKGILLFLALGLLGFLATLGIEYFLWLGTLGRSILFFCGLVGVLFLFYRFVFIPILFLVKVKRGISDKDAAILIGKHFPNIGDRLFNLLDLAKDSDRSELVIASIEQRSTNMKLVPFADAIDLGESAKYAKYLGIPLVLVGIIWASGSMDSFFGSYKRVVNYSVAYERPAPFKFELLTPDLRVLEDREFAVWMTTSGKVRPESVAIVVEGKEALLQKEGERYKYRFIPPLQNTTFFFKAGELRSRNYDLKVLKTPVIENFELSLEYPEYTEKISEVLMGTGNAVIPEGTRATWKLFGRNTEEVRIVDKDTAHVFQRDGKRFQFARTANEDYEYRISTSNGNVREYESLEYRFEVIKDAHPGIRVKQIKDSLDPNVYYYVGEVSDDYEVDLIQLRYYPTGNLEEEGTLEIGRPKSNFERFYYTFPSGLELASDTDYSFYFVAVDNDAIHGGKVSKSRVFTGVLLGEEELKRSKLETQEGLINNLDGSLRRAKEQKEVLKDLQDGHKERGELDFKGQNQIKDFLHKQQQQEQLMEKFSQELKENLKDFKSDNAMNKLLQERLERRELEAKKNERLLKELDKIAGKIEKDELTKRLNELAKQQWKSERNLEQLVELTKRYYVTEKTAQLARELDELSKKQMKLSEISVEEEVSKKGQERIKGEFGKLDEELEELQEDNERLKKPLDIKVDEDKKEEIKEDLQQALEEMNKHQGTDESSEKGGEESKENKVRKKQRSASQRMKEMGEQLGSTMGGGGGSEIVEDAEMLRQILDNLVTFSFKQEGLFERLEELEYDDSYVSTTVREQKELRDLFEHVDDSLFALSLRRVELSEFVNNEITEVYYNMDKSLENFAESQMFQGVSHQKYVLNASNKLADFLASILDNMQQSMMSGSGQGGQGGGFQLPDIIKGQEQLGERMQGKGKTGQGGESNNGNEGKEGEGRPKNGTEEGSEGEVGQKGEGSGKGTDGGNAGGVDEGELKEIYEIYKEQQVIRQRLEEQLQNMINENDRKLGEKLVRQMEDFERDLLENGITQRTISRANRIEHELLKLENASLQQGKKSERESRTNDAYFGTPVLTRPDFLDNYKNEVEILNRESLPLRRNFQGKVKDYFEEND